MSAKKCVLYVLLACLVAAVVLLAPKHSWAAPPLELSEGWAIRSANEVADGGATISQVGYDTSGWYPTNVPSTVLAALVANGVYQDIYYSKNLDSVPDLTSQDWWYRVEFTAPPASAGQEYWLRFKGINYRADVWLNGTQIGDKSNVVGVYANHEFNVTDLINPGGANALALQVTPQRLSGELLVWYVDWNPYPPDGNVGIWNRVYLDVSGSVAVRDPYVKTDLPLPATSPADLTVYADVVNGSDSPVSGVLKGEITKAGHSTISFSQPVTLAANERKEVTFDPSTYTQLRISDPDLWWPYGYGSPELYALDTWFEIDGQESDRRSIDFGIREFSDYLTPPTFGTQYWGVKVNGQNILIRGAAYVWDLLLRITGEFAERDAAQMQYVKDMGLNAIRFEGKVGYEDLYDIADREGIMLMVGWVCCSHWEHWSSWDSEDYTVAYASTESQIRNLRSHPSAFVWMHGSDEPPPADVLSQYESILSNLHWQNLQRENAATWSNPDGGIKMEGPYKWEPPYYWYWDTVDGGAFGFCAEQSPGAAVPPLESLQKFIPPDHLWPVDDYWDYHAGTKGSVFADIDVFEKATNERYGTSSGVEQFAERSQLTTYEAVRAQFEAYGAHKSSTTYNATGTIYWMLDNAWPSLHWHLYDYYLKPGGGYYGAKTALKPLQVVYDYDTQKVMVVNSTLDAHTGMTVSARVYNIDLTEQYSNQVTQDIGANSAVEAFTIPSLSGLSTTYFIRLELRDSSNVLVSSNLYWYSTTPDLLRNSSTWWYRPTKRYADLTGLNSLPTNSDVSLSASAVRSNGEETATITVSNAGSSEIAFFMRVEVTKGSGGEEVLPAFYEDNYFTLWPGEERTITATYETADLDGQSAYVRVDGYNVPVVSVAMQY
jgi:exo-1,4-beta-D-glucosaminidase